MNAISKLTFAAVLVSGIMAKPAHAQIYTALDSFDGTDGLRSQAGLVQATNGDLYGTAQMGGAGGNGTGSGTIFKLTPGGTLSRTYSFSIGVGSGAFGPTAGLIQAANGDFYGTTAQGGTNECENGCGAVFKITPAGTLTTLHTFCSEGTYPDCTDGWGPAAGLVQATNGDLYGTTEYGGTNGMGTVFKITPSGTLTTLYNFCSAANCTDGAWPEQGLVQAANGDLYGTTAEGGGTYFESGVTFNEGTIFKITQGGKLTTIYSFCLVNSPPVYCLDGATPKSVLVQAADGNLYGTTWGGGSIGVANGACSAGCGTVFRITPSGTLTTLHDFCSEGTYPDCTDGFSPQAGLIQATDGNLYGTTWDGGANGNGGTIFNITTGGTLTTLYSFCSQPSCEDGQFPMMSLTQDTNGVFYGTTYGGGSTDDGVVFSLSTGLGPFVETQTASGKVGATIKILGTDLTGATSVTFNGTAATFTVASKSEIKATVPTGATTGFIEVTTPGGTLTSNVPFTVTP